MLKVTKIKYFLLENYFIKEKKILKHRVSLDKLKPAEKKVFLLISLYDVQ